MIDKQMEQNQAFFQERLRIIQAKADAEQAQEQAPLKRPNQTVFVPGQNIKIDGQGFHVEKVTPNGRIFLSVIPTPGGVHV